MDEDTVVRNQALHLGHVEFTNIIPHLDEYSTLQTGLFVSIFSFISLITTVKSDITASGILLRLKSYHTQNLEINLFYIEQKPAFTMIWLWTTSQA